MYQSLEALERKLAEGKPLPSTEEGFEDLLKELAALEREKSDKTPSMEDLLKTLEEVDGLSDVMEAQCFLEERSDVSRRWERVKDEVSNRGCFALDSYRAVVNRMWTYQGHVLCTCVLKALYTYVCIVCMFTCILCMCCVCLYVLCVYMYCVCVYLYCVNVLCV